MAKNRTSSNRAAQEIASGLEKAFADVGEKIRQDLISKYRNHALGSFNSFMEASRDEAEYKGFIGGRKPLGRGHFNPFKDFHAFVKYDKDAAFDDWRAAGSDRRRMPPVQISYWEDVRAIDPQYLSVDYHIADKEANLAYESARDGFIWKNVGKVENVLGAREDMKGYKVKFAFRRGAFDGSLMVALDGASFEAEIGLKYVVRTIPKVTPYFQYPLVFVAAEVGGQIYKRPSEEELRVLLGGGAKPTREEELVARGICPGSGLEVPPADYARVARLMGKYLQCPTCKATVSVTGGRYRNHMAPAVKRASQAQRLMDEGYCPKSREKVSPEVIAAMGPVEPYKDPKVACEHCGQPARLDARKDWIFPTDGSQATQMKVTSAIYYKHRLGK